MAKKALVVDVEREVSCPEYLANSVPYEANIWKVHEEKYFLEHNTFVIGKETHLSAQEELKQMKFHISLFIHNGDTGKPSDGQSES